MSALPFDVARCHGMPEGLTESGRICHKRDECRRYLELETKAPNIPVFVGICQDENYDFHIPVEAT